MTRNRKKRSRNSGSPTHRDTTDITRQRLVESIIRPVFDMRHVEDRRLFHPMGYQRPALDFYGSRHHLREYSRPISSPNVNLNRRASRARPLKFFSRLGFQTPERTLVCVRRKVRREVMFARRKAGRRGQRPKRFNWFSSISCKRR